MEILTLNVADIELGDRLRDVDAERVQELATSIEEHGLLAPIEVRPAQGGKYELVIGAHRLTVAQLLGWKTIPAAVFDGSRDQARLREIDENLYRAELTPFDQAAFMAERRAIYERLNGQVKPGRKAGGKSRQVGANSAGESQLSFFDETTQKFGLPKRTIIRALSRRAKISDKAWELLRGTKFGRKGADLDALAKLEPAQQVAVVQRLNNGSSTTMAAAIRRVVVAGGTAPAQKTLAEKIISLWAKAGAADRKEVLAHLTETGAIGG